MSQPNQTGADLAEPSDNTKVAHENEALKKSTPDAPDSSQQTDSEGVTVADG